MEDVLNTFSTAKIWSVERLNRLVMSDWDKLSRSLGVLTSQSLRRAVKVEYARRASKNVSMVPCTEQSVRVRRPFSQARQDNAVLVALGSLTSGFFIDMAANDPYSLSNTAALEAEYGWNGLCIDAAVRSQRSFAQSNRTCTFVLALAGSAADANPVLFRELDPLPDAAFSKHSWMHGLSSVVKSEIEPTCWGSPAVACRDTEFFKQVGVVVAHRWVVPRSLDAILMEANAPPVIDFLSLDVTVARLEPRTIAGL